MISSILRCSVPADSLSSNPDAESAYVTLRTAMSVVCSAHVARCEEVIDTHADTSGQDVDVQVQPVLANPPYNTRKFFENT